MRDRVFSKVKACQLPLQSQSSPVLFCLGLFNVQEGLSCCCVVECLLCPIVVDSSIHINRHTHTHTHTPTTHTHTHTHTHRHTHTHTHTDRHTHTHTHTLTDTHTHTLTPSNLTSALYL